MREQITEILRTEGILSQGFGISPKILYRDKRLTPEAKAIYGYISSFAGNGNTAFPGRDLMLDELGMSPKRYYKHFNQLIQCGYITVIKQRDKFGSFDRNIYTLVSNPFIQQQEAEGEKTETFSTADLNPSEKVHRTAGDGPNMPVRIELDEENWLRKSMGIDEIIEQQPEDRKCVEKIYMAALDMADCEQIRLGGTIKSRRQIEAVLGSLNTDTTRATLYKYKQVVAQDYKIHNTKAFLQTLICNSPFDTEEVMEQIASVQAAKEGAERERKEVEREQHQEETLRQQREEVYAAHPELKEKEDAYSDVLINLSKVILTGSEEEKERLLERKVELECQIEEYRQMYQLPDAI